VTDLELKMMGLTRSEYRLRDRKRLTERWKPSFKKQIAAVEGGGHLVLYPGIQHMSFSDSPLSGVAAAEAAAQIRNINAYVLDFFDTVLMHKPAKLLDKGESKDSPIIGEFLKK
jgi:hypothetical protein